MKDRLILIVNDDGIESPGLKILADTLEQMGANVYVCAPDSEKSAVSHGISLRTPLRMSEIRRRWFSISGSPADCTYMGLFHVLPYYPDFVFSGINNGFNLGNDVFYSGTVAGATEAALRGIPAMSISCDRGADKKVLTSAALNAVVSAIRILNMKKIVQHCVFNLNHPTSPNPKGIMLTELGLRQYEDEVQKKLDPKNIPYYWIGGPASSGFSNLSGGERYALENNFISLTPLNLKMGFENNSDFSSLESS